jgi:hypothetical protein
MAARSSRSFRPTLETLETRWEPSVVGFPSDPGGLPGTGLALTGLLGQGLPGTGIAATGLSGRGLPGTGLASASFSRTGLANTGMAANGLSGRNLPGTGVLANGLARTQTPTAPKAQPTGATGIPGVPPGYLDPFFATFNRQPSFVNFTPQPNPFVSINLIVQRFFFFGL